MKKNRGRKPKLDRSARALRSILRDTLEATGPDARLAIVGAAERGDSVVLVLRDRERTVLTLAVPEDRIRSRRFRRGLPERDREAEEIFEALRQVASDSFYREPADFRALLT